MEEQITLQIETSKSGDSTLKVYHKEQVYYLHSKYYPAREAETWANSFYEEGKLSILIGIGLGYYAKALVEKLGQDDRILIIEPYEKIFKAAQDNSLAELNDPRVIFCLEKDKEMLGNILRSLIQQRFLQNSKVFVAPNYDKITDVAEINDQLKRSFKDYSVDINTKLLLAHDWQRNYLKNIKYAMQSCPLTAFEKKFTCPVIIVSAGPSLQEELENLKKIYHHAIILSAGSATPILLKNDVRPHMIVSIDGHIKMFEHLEEMDYEEIPLCYAPITQHKILEQHTGAKIIFQASGIDIADWYNSVIGFETGIVTMAPSVANFCLDIAFKLTSGPICFVGQDLGYVGGFSHAEGNNNRVSKENAKLEMLLVDSNDGNPLYAGYDFVLMREWFEKYLYEDSRNNIYNASLHGAKIAGTHVIEFERFIDEYCQEKIDIKHRFEEIIESWNETNRSKKDDFDRLMKELQDSLYKIKKTTKIASELSEELLRKVKQRDEKNINRLLTKMSKVDNKIMSLKNKDGLLLLIIQLMVDILILWDEEDEDEYKKRVKIAEKNWFFYSNLYNMSTTVEEILIDEIQS